MKVEDAGVGGEGSETELVCSNAAWFWSVQRLHPLETL